MKPPAVDFFANAVSFNGSSDRVDLPSSPLYNIYRTSDYTVGVWFNTDSAAGLIFNYHRGSTHRHGMIIAGGQFRSGHYDGSYVGNNAANISTGTWYHGLMTMDGATETGTSYLNGLAIAGGSGSSLGLLSAGNRSWGYSTSGGGQYFDGLLFDGRIYERKLTTDEILWLGTQGASGTDPGAADNQLLV